MGPTRFERVTSRLSAVRSDHAKLRARQALLIRSPLNNSFPVVARAHCIAVSRFILSSEDGWVEKRDASIRPRSGFTIIGR